MEWAPGWEDHMLEHDDAGPERRSEEAYSGGLVLAGSSGAGSFVGHHVSWYICALFD